MGFDIMCWLLKVGAKRSKKRLDVVLVLLLPLMSLCNLH